MSQMDGQGPSGNGRGRGQLLKKHGRLADQANWLISLSSKESSSISSESTVDEAIKVNRGGNIQKEPPSQPTAASSINSRHRSNEINVNRGEAQSVQGSSMSSNPAAAPLTSGIPSMDFRAFVAPTAVKQCLETVGPHSKRKAKIIPAEPAHFRK